LAQRREARRVAARRALGLGMLLARGLRLVLQRAPTRARRGLGLGGGGDLRLGRCQRLLFGLDLAPPGLELGLNLGEAVLAGQTASRAGRRIGGGREAVPAPEVALARYQALARVERRPEARGMLAPDHSPFRQTSRPLL